MASTILLTREFPQPASRVFAALDDHANMGSWLGQRVSVIKQAPDGGVGTVRRVHSGPINLDEEIVEREAPKRIVYRIVAGMPGISHHRGEITVEPQGDSRSVVRWHIELDSGIPGYAWLLLRAVNVALGGGLARLEKQLTA